MSILKHQRGTTIIEFTIVASVFFILLFAIIEFGRLLFTWHVLNETTRQTARFATVCQITQQEQSDLINRVLSNKPALPNFDMRNIKLSYLDGSGVVIEGDLSQESQFNQIRYVRASIVNYHLPLTIPFFVLDLFAPDFSTTLPRESLGILRPDSESDTTIFSDC